MQNISFLQDLAKKTGINLNDIFGNHEEQPQTDVGLPDIPLGLGGNIPATTAALPEDSLVGLGNFGLGGGTAGAVSQGGAASGAAALPPLIEVPPHRYADPNRFAGLNVPEPQQQPVVFPEVSPMTAPTTREMLPSVNFGTPITAPGSKPVDLAGAVPQISGVPSGRTAEKLFQPQYSDSQEYEPAQPRPTADVAATAPYDPTSDLTESEKKLLDLNNPENYRPPTYQNTNPDSPTFGMQSSDPGVVKSWGKDNAARIDEGGKSRNKKWSLLEKIGGAAMGWLQGGLAGGIRGGTDRNYFNKQRDAYERAELLPQIAAQQQIEAKKADTAYKRQLPGIKNAEIARKYQKDKQDFDARIADRASKEKQGKPWTSPDTGIVYWLANDGTKKVMMKPDGSGPERNPDMERYEWTPPGSKTPVTISGTKLAEFLTNIEVGNAQRTQATTLANVRGRFDAQKTNVQLKQAYLGKVAEQMEAVAKAGGETAGALSEAQGYIPELQADAAKLDAMEPDADPKAYEAAKKAFDEKMKVVHKALASTQAGIELTNRLKAIGYDKPGDIEWEDAKPSLVGSGTVRGRRVASADDPRGYFELPK